MDHAELVTHQKRHFEGGSTRSLEARRAALGRLSERLEKHERALLDALHADLGKGEVEAFTTEIQQVRMECRYLAKHLGKWMKPERRKVPFLAWPGKARLRREPCGVVLILGPWNYPVQLLLTPLAGALAAGNCAVLKPSEHTPTVAAAIAAMISECFEPGLVTVVEGGPEVAVGLQEQRFDHVFFTGGTAIGRKVMAAAAKHLTPVTLELGGKCPALVFGRDMVGSLEVAARRIAWGKFLNAGQTCVAADHVWVERALHEPLVEALGKAFESFRGGEYGRMIHRAAFDRVRGFFADGEIAYGGECDAEKMHLWPTVLTGVKPDAAVMREEVFGPVLPVLAVDGLDEALGELRKMPDPLAVYVFTDDEAVTREVLGATRSGGVCVNDTVLQITGPELPFGGIGESGMGRYRGRASFETFSRQRLVMTRPLGIDLKFRYPPARLDLVKMKKLPKWMGGG